MMSVLSKAGSGKLNCTHKLQAIFNKYSHVLCAALIMPECENVSFFSKCPLTSKLAISEGFIKSLR